MYHDVSPEGIRGWGPWQYSVTSNRFEEQIARIHRVAEPVDIDSVVGDDQVPDDAVVVTFDDGFQNTLDTAVPILESYGVPATVYVSTGSLGDVSCMFEFTIAEALRELDRAKVSLPGLSLDRPLETKHDLVEIYEQFHQWGKPRSTDDRQRLLDQLSVTIPRERMLSPDGVRDLGEHPLITVGAHGHEHIPLTIRSTSSVRKDLNESRNRLSPLVGHGVAHLSYPYGAYSNTITDVVEAVGFESAVSTREAEVVLKYFEEQRYELPRYDASDGLDSVL